MLKAPRLFLCLNGRETYAYIPPEVVARACDTISTMNEQIPKSIQTFL